MNFSHENYTGLRNDVQYTTQSIARSDSINKAKSEEPFGIANLLKPRVNVIDTPDAVKLEVAAPGMNKDAFCIDSQGNELVIAYEHDEDMKCEPNVTKCRMGGYDYLSFRRILPLPDYIDKSKIGTHYINGVLNVVLPKKQEACQQ